MYRTLTIFILCITTISVVAQTSYNQIILQPDSANYFYQKGIEQKEKGSRLESLKYFEKASQYDSTNKTITGELALAYFDLRKYNNARVTYKKLVSMGDESPANLRKVMELSYQLKQNDDVIAYAKKLQQADPSQKVNYFLGKVFYDTDNYGEAIKYLQLAGKEEPTNAEIPYLLAHSYTDMRNYKMAIPFYKKAIELDPANSRWIYEMSLIYYAIHEDKESLNYMLQAGEKGYKRDNDYLENLGIAYLNSGDLDNGVKILTEVLQRKPADMNLLNMLAEAYYYKGKYKPAMEYWDKMLEYDKESASSLYMIGMCYQKMGGEENKQKGVKLCDKAIEMDPSLANNKQKKQMMGM